MFVFRFVSSCYVSSVFWLALGGWFPWLGVAFWVGPGSFLRCRWACFGWFGVRGSPGSFLIEVRGFPQAPRGCLQGFLVLWQTALVAVAAGNVGLPVRSVGKAGGEK